MVNKDNKEQTTTLIRVGRSLKAHLDEKGKKNESYDAVIKRLLKRK